MTDDASLASAVAGSTYVVHIAAPITFFQTEEAYVRPAVDGTLSVLRACKANGVRRCVITSSIAACVRPIEAEAPADGIINESHWSEIPAVTTHPLLMYCKAKTMAEKAAWDFQAALPEAERFEIVTILPSYIMGPTLRKDMFASGDWVRKLMVGETTEISSDSQAICDVRDTAFAHFKATIVPDAANKRFIIAHSSPKYAEYAQPLIDKYAPLGWPICQTHSTAEPTPKHVLSNAASREILGVQYRDFQTTMLDMADSMIRLGSLQKPEPVQQ